MHVVPKPSFEITLQKSEIELEQQRHQCTHSNFYFKQDKKFHRKKIPICKPQIYNRFLLLSNDFTVWWNYRFFFTMVQIKSGSSFPNTFFILNWSFLLFQKKNTSHFQPWSAQIFFLLKSCILYWLTRLLLHVCFTLKITTLWHFKSSKLFFCNTY